MLSIAVNALYTTLRKRGTTRQLAAALIAAVVSALLLFPALLWYHLRFSAEQAALSPIEIGLMLVYVALWGWILPFGVTIAYCLFTTTRDSNTAGRLPRQRKRTTRARAVAISAHPPRRQLGVLSPYVYNAATPWGWLEYRNGKFLGQELALKRTIVSLGREEDNEVWLDDDTISRYHAELAWEKGQVYITDNESLNGVLLNGRRIRTSLPVKNGDLLEIGAHQFLMKYAQQPVSSDDLDDPLLPQLRRAALNRNSSDNHAPMQEKPLAAPTRALQQPEPATDDIAQQETAEIAWKTPLPLAEKPGGLCILRSGEMAGRSFLLDRPTLTIGRGAESDIVIYDTSISRRHAQFSRQADGDYVQDLASRNSSQVNGEPLQAPRLLHMGDVITLGEVHLEYLLVPDAQTTPMSFTPSAPSPFSLPMPMHLPSKSIE